MPSYSRIKHLYAYENGDTITPWTGVQIDVGYALQQYVDANTGKVIATKFKEHNAILFPQPYSSRGAKTVVPETSGQQWYYGNITDEGAILEDGAVKSKFAGRFKLTTVDMNNNTFPALAIVDELVGASQPTESLTDKYIFYVSSYEGKQFTCQWRIPVQQAVPDACQVIVSILGPNNVSGDEVISNEQDYIQYVVNLQRNGENIASGVTFKFQKLVGSEWKDCTTVEGDTEVGTNTLKLYESAVDGSEQYRVVVTYNSQTYYALMNPTDEHDPFYVVDGCNIPGEAVKDEETVTFSPQVYERSTGVVSTGWTFAYTIYRATADPDAPDTYPAGSVITDLTVDNLTGKKIREKGGIRVRTTASRD